MRRGIGMVLVRFVVGTPGDRIHDSDAFGSAPGGELPTKAGWRRPRRRAAVEKNDWESIVVLYEALGQIAPSPVVVLNRPVAIAMVHGPFTALAIVDKLAARDRLRPTRT